MSIKSVMPSSHPILCHPLLLLPPTLPSIRVFSNKSTLRMRWPKYWSFSFSISPSNEHPGLISSRMDQLDLLAVQGTLNKSLELSLDDPNFVGNSQSIIVRSQSNKCRLSIRPDQGVDLSHISVLELLHSLFSLVLVGPDIHSEH